MRVCVCVFCGKVIERSKGYDLKEKVENSNVEILPSNMQNFLSMTMPEILLPPSFEMF